LLETLVAVRILLGLIFLGGAVPKLLDLGRFHRVIRSYALLPAWAIKPATLALPIVELGLAVALLGGWGSTLAGASATGLLVVFAAVIAVNVVRRTAIDCGCGGWEGPTSVGWSLVARNLILASAAAAVAAHSPESMLTLLNRHVISVSDIVALALCAGLVLIAFTVAHRTMALLGASRTLAEMLESAARR